MNSLCATALTRPSFIVALLATAYLGAPLLQSKKQTHLPEKRQYAVSFPLGFLDFGELYSAQGEPLHNGPLQDATPVRIRRFLLLPESFQAVPSNPEASRT